MTDNSKSKHNRSHTISDYSLKEDSISGGYGSVSKIVNDSQTRNWNPALIESVNSSVSQVYISDSPSNNERISELIEIGSQIGKKLRHVKALESDLLRSGTPREIIEQRILAELNLQKEMK